MIGAQNTLGQKCWVGIVQWAPETSVSEEIVDIFRNYYIDSPEIVCRNKSKLATSLNLLSLEIRLFSGNVFVTILELI